VRRTAALPRVAIWRLCLTLPALGWVLLLIGGAIGLWPSIDRAVSLQKLAVMGLAAAMVLGLPVIAACWRRRFAGALVAGGVAASLVGNILVDRASWKLDPLNRAVYGLFAHVPRFSDLAFSQNGLAAVVVVALPFAVALPYGRPGVPGYPAMVRRLVGIGAGALLFVELLVTESRAAILSLGLAAGVAGAVYLRGRWRWLALASPGLAVGLLASGLVSLPVSLSWQPTGGSSAERFAIWQSSLLMIADMPLTGIGLGMFQRVYPLYILPAYRNIHPHAHNLFLQSYLDTGPLGCAGMVLLTAASIAAMARLWRHRPEDRPLAVAAAVSWTAGFLHAQVDSYFAGDPRTYFVLFVPLALLLASSPAPAMRPRLSAAALLTAVGVMVAALPWLLAAFWTNLGTAARLHEDVRPAEAAYARALALQPHDWVAERGLGLLGSQEWLRRAIADGAPGALVHAELARTLPLGESIAEWRRAGGAPYLVRLAEASKDDIAREDLLLAALEVEPKEASAKGDLARLYLSQARFPEARAILESWSGSAEPKLLLALMGTSIDGAHVSGAITGGHEDLGRAYEALGLYDDAARQFEAMADPIGHYELAQLQPAGALPQLRLAVAAIPNQEDFRLALARAYARSGAAVEAQEQFAAVLALNPGNSEAKRALGHIAGAMD
jgi:O-antigen ligase